jgi:hypothetical protein
LRQKESPDKSRAGACRVDRSRFGKEGESPPEHDHPYIEVGRYRGTPETLAALVEALGKAGVEFSNGKRPGVRLKALR